MTLLDDLKIFKDYCTRNLFSGRNFSPEKSLQKNLSIFLSRKSVLRPALLTLQKRLEFNMYHGGCSVSLSLNLILNINLSLSVAPDARGDPCSNTCCGRGNCSIGSYSSNGSYSNGGCSSNHGMLCARAAAPGSLRRSAPSRTVFVFCCAVRQGKRVRGGCWH